MFKILGSRDPREVLKLVTLEASDTTIFPVTNPKYLRDLHYSFNKSKGWDV